MKIFDLDGDVLRRGPKLNGSGYADWTPDGAGLIVSDSPFDDEPGKLLYFAADGTEQRTIKALRKGGFSAPSFSPNGKRMAVFACFSRYSCETGDKRSIFTAGIHGENWQEVLSGKGLSLVGWSPRSNALLVCKKGLRYLFRGALHRVRGVRACSAAWA